MIGPPTFGDKHFVLLLRVEAAELGACEDAEASGVTDYTPLFAVVPIPYTDPPLPNTRQRIRRPPTASEIAIRLMNKARSVIDWADRPRGQARPRGFVDVAKMDNEYGGSHLGALFAHFGTAYPEAVPLTYIDRPIQHPEVAAIDARHGAGMALRLNVRPALDLTAIDATLRNCAVPADRTDLILDLGYLEPENLRRSARMLPAKVRALVAHAAWRTITVLGSSMPLVPHGGVFTTRRIVRWEWHIWRTVRAATVAAGNRCPTYGDYGMLPPDYELPDFARGPQPYVKYTSWRLSLYVRRPARGRGARAAAYRDICIELVATPQYRRCGPLFSVGDQEIYSIARGTRIASGSAGHWLRIMTDHHLVFTTRQIARVP